MNRETLQTSLEALQAERERIGAAISEIMAELKNGARPPAAEKIPKTRGKRSYNGTHWTQSAAGKKRMSKMQRERFAKAKAAKKAAAKKAQA